MNILLYTPNIISYTNIKLIFDNIKVYIYNNICATGCGADGSARGLGP